MGSEYRFDDSEAKLEEGRRGFSANCQCGWSSEPKATKEEAIIAFENHVRSDPRHTMDIERDEGTNLLSLLIASMGFIYILSPVDFVPDSLVLVGWIEDILLAVFCSIFAILGFEGKSPGEIVSDIF